MAEITVIKPTEKPIRKLRCGAYCRVSTDSTDQKHSFLAQRNWFVSRFAVSETEELTDIYADIGISGTTSERPEFMRMLADCRSGRLDRIVTKSVSRFARNTRDCLVILRELKEIGVTVFFEKENIDTARSADEMMIAVMGGLAQEESRSISENIRWSLRRKMASGTLGIARVPYGYDKTEDGTLTVNEYQAEVIKRIFSMYIDGLGARRIAALLNNEGIPSPTGEMWNNNTIYKMLVQEKYLGDIRWQKTASVFMGKSSRNIGQADSFYITDHHPAIVDEQTFLAVQNIRAENRRAAVKHNNSPFRHKLTCGLCGRSYYYIDAYRPYWQCSGRFDLSSPCSNVILHDDTVHQMWKIILIKLSRHTNDILIPLTEQLRQVSALLSERKEYDRLDEIRVQKMALRKMCTESLISYGEVLSAETELNAEYTALTDDLVKQTEHFQTLSAEIRELNRLIPICADGGNVTAILKNARILFDSADFELISGLHIRCGLSDRVKPVHKTEDMIKTIYNFALCGKCGGKLSRRNTDGAYLWRCTNGHCSYRKMRIPDDVLTERISQVTERVRKLPRLIKVRQEVTVYRPGEAVKRMGKELALLMENNVTESELLISLIMQSAEERFQCIAYHDTNERTAEILSAITNYSDLPTFINSAVKHIYVTPEIVRIKFINGKSVKSERSILNG